MTQALVDHYVGVGERLKVMVRAYEARMGRLPTRQSDIGPEYAQLYDEYKSLKRKHKGLAEAGKRQRSAGLRGAAGSGSRG